jgi:sugar phosphate isomerase/epimerase
MACRYAWENEAGGLSPEEHLDWMRALESGAFGLVLDTGHAHINGTTDTYLAGCGGLLCNLHLDDNNGSTDQHRIPGTAGFPWQGFVARLKRAGYIGPLMLEVEARDRQGDLEAVLREARASIELLKRVGVEELPETLVLK